MRDKSASFAQFKPNPERTGCLWGCLHRNIRRKSDCETKSNANCATICVATNRRPHLGGRKSTDTDTDAFRPAMYFVGRFSYSKKLPNKMMTTTAERTLWIIQKRTMEQLLEVSDTPHYFLNGHWSFWRTVGEMEDEDLPLLSTIMAEYYKSIKEASSLFGIDALEKAAHRQP